MLTFLLINGLLYVYNMCVVRLFLYLSVLLAGKCHPRTDVRYMLHCHVDGEISPRRQHTISSQVRNLNLKVAETQTKISITL